MIVHNLEAMFSIFSYIKVSHDILQKLISSCRLLIYTLPYAAILSGELRRESAFIPREVKFGLLTLWLPLCCHGSNGLSYHVMTGLGKVDAERATDEVISSLPAIDQEVILTNWFQEFTFSSSD